MPWTRHSLGQTQSPEDAQAAREALFAIQPFFLDGLARCGRRELHFLELGLEASDWDIRISNTPLGAYRMIARRSTSRP